MLQKTYRTRTLLEYEDMISEIVALDDYEKATHVLAFVFYEIWDKNRIFGNAKKLKSDLPKVEIAATCNGNEHIKIGEYQVQGDGTTYSFLFFDTADFQIFRYDAVSKNTYVVNNLKHDLSKLHDIKALVTFFASPVFDTDGFFAAMEDSKEDYPIYGAKSGVPFIFYDEEQHASSKLNPSELMTGFVADETGAYSDSVIVVALYGKDLHAKASYNFGWTPIGKIMTITKTDGGLSALEIDGAPANSIYKKYLDLDPEYITTNNVSDFPLISVENGRIRARIGSTGKYPGSLDFFTPISEGDHLQFSYGNEKNIFKEAYDDACDYAAFMPQALFMSPCINRFLMLGEREKPEIDYYRDVQPNVAILRGFGEALRDSIGYGLYNSALVVLGLREGDVPADGEIPKVSYHEELMRSQSIPLVSRLATFLEQTTSELSELAKQASAANNAKSAFLSNMSHEVRTPINAILGLDEMILNEATEEHIKKYAADIQSAGRVLLSLINEVLDISRLEAGRMEILPTEYELSSTINDLVNTVRVPLQNKNLEFKTEVDENIPRLLRGDETRIKQCVSNILTNAVKYTESGSVTLSVSFEKEDEKHILLCFRVRDTGIGIREEDLKKLAQPFERFDEQRNHAIEGTGLGMAIVSQILELMGSHLEVESKYNEGSDFSFVVRQEVVDIRPIGAVNEGYHPAKDEVEALPKTVSYTAPEARVLVCDDNEVNLLVFSGLLKDTEVQITTTESGMAAIDAVQKEAFDVIFLDQRMPSLSGVETLQKMKELPGNLSKDAPVIVLTATAVAGAREEFLNAGFDDYLSKPVTGPKLKEALLIHLPKDKVNYQ